MLPVLGGCDAWTAVVLISGHNPLGTIRIVIVDDHALLRSGLRRVIEFRPDLDVVGEAGDGLGGKPCGFAHSSAAP